MNLPSGVANSAARSAKSAAAQVGAVFDLITKSEHSKSYSNYMPQMVSYTLVPRSSNLNNLGAIYGLGEHLSFRKSSHEVDLSPTSFKSFAKPTKRCGVVCGI